MRNNRLKLCDVDQNLGVCSVKENGKSPGGLPRTLVRLKADGHVTYLRSVTKQCVTKRVWVPRVTTPRAILNAAVIMCHCSCTSTL